MHPIVAGAAAGTVATTVMTLSALEHFKRLPRRLRYPLPPRLITEQLARKAGALDALSDRQLRAATLVNHYGYGITMSLVYTGTVRRLPGPALVKGALYGLAVWAAGYQGWLPAAGILRPASEAPRPRNRMLIVGHLVWGATVAFLTDRIRLGSDPILT